MKKAKKIIIITAAIVATVGLICFLGGMIGMGFNFGNFNSSTAVTNTYKVDDAFKSILARKIRKAPPTKKCYHQSNRYRQFGGSRYL